MQNVSKFSVRCLRLDFHRDRPRVRDEDFSSEPFRTEIFAGTVPIRIYERLGDFDQADDAGDFLSGLEAAKRLAKESERTKNMIGWREAKI